MSTQRVASSMSESADAEKLSRYREDGLPTKENLKLMVDLKIIYLGKNESKFYDNNGQLYYVDSKYNYCPVTFE